MKTEEGNGTKGIRGDDGLSNLHNDEGLHTSEISTGTGLRTGEERSSTKPKVLLSCKECAYKTNYLPRRMARRRLQNHRRKTHPMDLDNKPEKTLRDDIAGEVIQRDHKEGVPAPLMTIS